MNRLNQPCHGRQENNEDDVTTKEEMNYVFALEQRNLQFLGKSWQTYHALKNQILLTVKMRR